MGLLSNIVSAGDYKNADIKVKGLRNDKVILVKRGLLGKDEVKLDKSTVDHITVVTQAYQKNQVEVYFKNDEPIKINHIENAFDFYAR